MLTGDRPSRRRPDDDRGLCEGHRGGQAGSVLLLFPAAVFALLVLAAVTLDVGLTHVRAQQLRSVAASAANDALGALDIDALRSTGAISFNQATAARLARAAVAEGPLPHAQVESVAFSRNSAGRWQISVTLSTYVRFVIAPALPGAAQGIRVSVTERVSVLSSGGG